MRKLVPTRESSGTLAHVVETLLDKGLVLNADIMVSVAGVELLGIRIRAALASFETAARYGLEFPSGTDTTTAAWREASAPKEDCPGCAKRVEARTLLDESCPWCGWRSARAKELAAEAPARALGHSRPRENPPASGPVAPDNASERARRKRRR